MKRKGNRAKEEQGVEAVARRLRDSGRPDLARRLIQAFSLEDDFEVLGKYLEDEIDQAEQETAELIPLDAYR